MGNSAAAGASCQKSSHEGATETFLEFLPEGSSFHSIVDGPEMPPMTQMMTHAMTHMATTTGHAGDWCGAGVESSGHSLMDLVSALEACTTMTVAKYRAVLKNSKESDEGPREIKRCEEALKRVEKQLKTAQRLRERQTWQGGEAEAWMNMYMGSRKRFKSFKVIASKVRVENSIIRHWRQQKVTNYRHLVVSEGLQTMPRSRPRCRRSACQWRSTSTPPEG